MNILIKLQNDSELISYESLSLAFVLSSFDHRVRLHLSPCMLPVLSDSNTRLHGMIQSLTLYDIPKAWVDDEHWDSFGQLPTKILAVIERTPKVMPKFDSIIEG